MPWSTNANFILTSTMLDWDDDLKLSGADLYLDSRINRPTCFISHAHSDHLGLHNHAICTPETAKLAEFRVGKQQTTTLDFNFPFSFDAATRLMLVPAGHVLGNAMLHVARPEGTLLYTGDFKLRQSLTVKPAAPVPADYLVMESTYGQPHFRFPPWRETAGRLVELVTGALHNGRQPIVMGYSLGRRRRSQES